jgi:hypothetical protein
MLSRIILGIRLVFIHLAWLFVAGILFQAYLAGLGLLGRGSNLITRQRIWDTHIGLGHSIGILPFLMLLLVFLGRFPRAIKARTGLLFGLYILQTTVFAMVRQDVPALAALHPALALVLFVSGLDVAWRSWKVVVMEWQGRSEPANTPSSLPTPK